MKAYKKFEDLLNRRSYGVVFYQQKDKLKALFEGTDWFKIAFLSTNSAVNLGQI